MSEPIHIISLGAGVQSSVMALMASYGEITPMPTAAIFADTGDEPDEVMRWLEYLEPKLAFPVHRVQSGVLSEDFLAALRGECNRCGQPPYFVRNPDSDGTTNQDDGGLLRRKCTTEYKIDVVKQEARRIMVSYGAKSLVQWIGISLDEALRMKDSRVKYIANRYPLIDARMSRWDCIRWMEKRGLPTPPKSACWHCPYRSNAGWRYMRDNQPEAWAKAVAYDAALREARRTKVNGAGIKGELFLHRSFKPLSEVDLSTDIDRGQMELGFGNECEGMCGL